MNNTFFDGHDKRTADLFKQHNINMPSGKTVGGIFAAAFAVWCLWALVVLAAICGIAYVAWHFISKVW